MLSSKELLEKSGLSRATLNNYIALGLLPRPLVKHPEEPDDRARRLGYFPESALDIMGAKKASVPRPVFAAGTSYIYIQSY